MVNASLSTGYFPDNWKEAIINPLFKKGAIDFAYNNLHPVRNLQFVSKITERAVFDQLYAHVMNNELFPEFQSLCKIVNDILLDMNRQHVSLLVLLDLSAAFDTVDHIILLPSRDIIWCYWRCAQMDRLLPVSSISTCHD